MRIAVIGAGAMGGLFGGYLSRQNDVTLIDISTDVVEKINRDGLEVREPDGSSNVFHPKAVQSSEGMEPVELLILFLSSLYSDSVLQTNRAILGPKTCVMTLQNGSGHEKILSRYVPQENIIIGTTQHNASVDAPGVSNHGGSGVTYLGCVVGSSSRLQKFADTFTACGLEAYVSDDVQTMIWNKLFTNVSVSALTAALQVPMGFISGNAHAWALCKTLVREAVDVAEALGMHFEYEQIIAEVKAVCDKSPNGLTSIYAALRDGRRSEVDSISGSVVRAGREVGVPTPSHEFLVELIHAMEERGKA